MKSLLTVLEAAELLRVSPATVYALVSRKMIRHERVGLSRRGKIVIPEDAIEEYRLGRTVEVGEGGELVRLPAAPVKKYKPKHLKA